MKKVFIILLSVVALLAFTVSAYALHGVKDMFEYKPGVVKSKKAQIELGGEIRIRGELANNNSDFKDTDDKIDDFNTSISTVLADTNVQNAYMDLLAASNATELASALTDLSTALTPFIVEDGDGQSDTDDDKAAYDQRVRLHLKATVSPNTFGYVELESDGRSYDTWTWGQYSNGSGIYNNGGNSKTDTLYIRQAYIAHQGTGLLGRLSGFKAGHMLFGLGNGLFYDHTKFGDDGMIFWTQPMDNTEIALAILKLGENGGVAGSADDVDAYALTAETTVNGLHLSGDITYLNDNTPSDDGAGARGGLFGNGANLWNFGIRGNTAVQSVNLSADLEFQKGALEATQSGGDDMDIGGWAVELKADAKVGDIAVRGGFAYGSGDDIDSENDYEGFITSIGSGQHYTYLYDQKAVTAGQAIVAGKAFTSSVHSYMDGNATNTGLNNTWYLTAGASANVNPDTKVSADIYYLQASEKVSDVDNYDETDIGVEIDGKVTYQIDTNFVYYVEGGYLFAGDFYKNVTAFSSDDISDPDSPDDAYSIRHGILLKF